MVLVLNRAQGPRVFNVKAGEGRVEQVTLLPGQSRDLDLDNREDRVLKAWVDAEEVMIGSDAERRMRRDATGREERAERIASLRKELAELEAEDAADAGAAAAAAKAPPAQFGGDGGPEQMPTIAGDGGTPTPKQEQDKPEPKAEAKAEAKAEPRKGRG